MQSGFNPIMLAVAKSTLTIMVKSLSQKHIKDISDGEIFVRTLPAILIQTFLNIYTEPPGYFL